MISSKEEEKRRLSNAIVEAVGRLESAFSRLDKVEKQLNLGVTAPPVKSSNSTKPPSAVRDLDELISSWLSPMLEASLVIGDVVEEQVDLLYSVLSALRSIIFLSCTCKKPNDESLLFRPFLDLMNETSELAEKNKSSKWFDHLSVISKGVNAFAWVSSSNPLQHVQQHKTQLEFLILKYLKESKLRTEQVAIIESFGNLIKHFEMYVMKHFQTGLSWNSTGKDAPSKLTYQTRGNFMGRISSGSPKIHLEGSKLYCENQTGEKTLDIETEKVTCNILYCSTSSITVKGKPMAVIIDGCNSTKVVLTDGTNTINLLNCQHVEIVASAPVSLINIERTYVCSLGLSDSNTEIIVNGSSNILLSLPKEDSPEPVEIPTQIKSKIKQGKVHTVLVTHNK